MASSQASRSALVVTNAAREYNCDSLGVIMNQNEPGIHTQGLNSGTELIWMEMPEVGLQYTHLQNVILEFPDFIVDTSPGPDWSATQTLTTPRYVESTLMTSPSLSTEAIDLTTVRSPSMCGDVLWSVLDKIRADEESPADASSILTRPCSAVRACLEKRFNSMSAAADIPTQQDAQSAALTKFRSVIEQSSERQDAFINPLMQKWNRSDLENPMELSVPYGGSMLNAFAGMHRQVLGNRNLPHMVEPNKHQGPVTKAQCNIRTIPAVEQQQQIKTECKSVAVAKPTTFVKIAKKRSPLSSKDCNAIPTQQDAQSASLTKFWSMIEQPSKGVAVAKPATFVKIAKKRSPLSSKDGNATQDSENWMAGLLSTKKVCISPTEKSLGARERHNMLERVRRKKISQCCDELNSLVPFCDKATDKANTLLWTTAFLRYINETHGDSIKQDFKNKVFLHDQTKTFSTMRT